MNKLLLIPIVVLFLLFGCDDDKKVDPPRPEIAQRTILAYLIGDNVNSYNELTTYMLSDFNEMCEGMKSVDAVNNNLLVYCETYNNLPKLIHVRKENGNIIADTLETFQEQNPLDIVVMKSVMQEVFEEFPALSYGLVLASHGHGWLPTSSPANPRHFGDYRGTNIDIPELRVVLDDVPHLDFLLFDACFMQAIEVAYELKDCTDYIISSPTEIPGPGGPYQKMIPIMFADKKDVGVDIAREYYEYYKDYEGEYYLGRSKYDWKEGVSVSAIKTAELDALATITNDILRDYYTSALDIKTIFCYDSDYSYSYSDFDRFIRLLTNDDEVYNSWRFAFDAVQLYFQTTPKNYANAKGGSFDMSDAQGISVYIPRQNGIYNSFYKTLSWYKNVGWAEIGW